MPTIVKGSDYFQVITYTGNGGTNAITGLSFQPDFVWIKGRSGATDHALYDAVRGATKDLVSNSTAAETTQSTGLVSFDSNGFTLGALSKVNTNGATYVAWCWKAGSSTVTNTSGTISSQVRANTTAGVSIVTYTNPASGTFTVGHGLGVAPAMMILKSTNQGGTNWVAYHQSLGNTRTIYLNLTDAAATTATWNNTSPTSTVFTGTTTWLGGSAYNYVAYCFAEIAGFSKFGSYTGNGSTDGPFNYLGFRPRWIMWKRTNSTSNWIIWDTARNTYNAVNSALFPDTSDAESTNTAYDIDVLSNGFKMRTSNATLNGSGSTYIFAAFAESPFKVALAR